MGLQVSIPDRQADTMMLVLDDMGVIAVLFVALVLAIAIQVHKLAQLADLLCVHGPRSGGVWQFPRNIRAILRSGWRIPALLVFVDRFWSAARVSFLRIFGARDGRSSIAVTIVDPGGRMSAAAKQERARMAMAHLLIPAVVFTMSSILFAFYVLHAQANLGWEQATTGAGLVLVWGFYAKWLHRWFAPLLSWYQIVRLIYAWGHGVEISDWRVPLHSYLDRVLPGWDQACVIRCGAEDPAYNCVFLAELYGLVLLAGFWGLSYLLLLVVRVALPPGADSGLKDI